MSPSAAVLPEKKIQSPKIRIAALDMLRGYAMLLVMLYHLLYDLRFIYKIPLPDILTPGKPMVEAVHICFLWVLFAVSGICTGYSRNPVKRGAVLYIAGWLITAASSVFMPSQLIVFGVLSCFGACMVITDLIKPLLKKIPWKVLAIGSFILWLCFMDISKSGTVHLLITDIQLPLPVNSKWLYPVGLRAADFKSADYFPVIPYIFMFLTGYALHAPVEKGKLPESFYSIKTGFVSFIGKHSLIFYALHQPLFLIILEIIFWK